MEINSLVDPRNYILSCPKVKPALIITAVNCEGCEHHRGFIENFPGTETLDDKGTVIKREIRKVKASELSLELYKGVMPSYVVSCAKPKALPLGILGQINHKVG